MTRTKGSGLYDKRDTAGKVLWYVRLYHHGKDRRFRSFPTKTKARRPPRLGAGSRRFPSFNNSTVIAHRPFG
jgi:hypothetical protein